MLPCVVYNVTELQEEGSGAPSWRGRSRRINECWPMKDLDPSLIYFDSNELGSKSCLSTYLLFLFLLLRLLHLLLLLVLLLFLCRCVRMMGVLAECKSAMLRERKRTNLNISACSCLEHDPGDFLIDENDEEDEEEENEKKNQCLRLNLGIT